MKNRSYLTGLKKSKRFVVVEAVEGREQNEEGVVLSEEFYGELDIKDADNNKGSGG